MTALTMTVDEALALADDWIQGTTFHADSKGANAIMLVLATEVRRLQSNQRAMCALADERAGETHAARLEAMELRRDVERLRADARRYRFVRRKVCIAGGQFHVLNLPWPTYVGPSAAIEFDVAIDAAMEASNAG